ncbi:MAG: DNA recombination protein RmuC [Chitinophagaceae bacterium]|nr:MAG: DNA recombination protein RmuC [Chitinophagaceae bacterium]
MEVALFVFVASCICLAVGIYIGRLLSQMKAGVDKAASEQKAQLLEARSDALAQQYVTEKAAWDKRIAHLASELENLRGDKETLAIMFTRKESDFDNLLEKHQSQQKEIETLNQKFTKEFENLANRILEEKSVKFTEQNKQNMHGLLHPLSEKIQLFERKVEDTHKESIDYHAALRQQILGLRDLNEQMSREAVNLTKALKGDSKMQGNWGELVLERVLEKSGLEKGREYEVQQSFTNDQGGRVFPDVVVNLPDGKKKLR